jgi:hypothetical protein
LNWHRCEESLLSISEDGQSLIIMNKKAASDPVHILEPDPNEV